MHIRILKRNDALLAALFFMGSLFLFYDTYAIRDIFSYSFGPRVFPRVILGLVAVLSACLFVQSLGFGPTTHKGTEAKAAPAPDKAARRQVMLLRGGTVALLLAYILALPYVGYVAATIPFLFLTMCFLGLRAPKKLALYAVIAVITTLSLQFIFGTLLKFFLP